MIIVTADNGAQFTFGFRVNAKAIVVYLAYYSHGQEYWSFTDAWPTVKREDIIIPDTVSEEAKAKAYELLTIE